MKCPDCNSELVLHNMLDFGKFRTFNCPTVQMYYHPIVKNGEGREHYSRITMLETPDIIHERFFFKQFYVAITRRDDHPGLSVGIIVQMIKTYPLMGTPPKINIPMQYQSIAVHFDNPILQFDDPTIFDNKSPAEIKKKIQTYLTFL